MKVERNHIVADSGKAIRRKGEDGTSEIVELWLSNNDSPDNWEDCEKGDGETMKYSTLSIKRELDKLIREDGISAWKRAKALLQDAEYWDDFILANYLSEQDEVFKTACGAMVARQIVTQAELDALLPKCVWTAE